jgi:tRNA G18 (ribose-2'-O)-methylase SpoU
MKLNAQQLRGSDPSKEELGSITRNPIYIIIDNVLDTYNVGAIFRLADAAAVSGVYLVGQTAVPTDEKVGHKIHKASVGVWQWVSWEHTDTVKEAVQKIKSSLRHPGLVPGSIKSTIDSGSEAGMTKSTLRVVAIEQHPNSIAYTKADYSFPIAFILGHETEGVSKEALELADQIVEIPMFGVNKSLNVMVSLAIVMWEAIGKKEENKNG